MSENPPIACTLTAPDYRKRLARMRALGEAALVNVAVEPTRAVLRFAAGTGIRDRVEAVVADESECCAFLTMTVTDEPDLVVLAMEAPADAELVLAELVAAFRGHDPVGA